MTEPIPTNNPNNNDDAFEQSKAFFRIRLESILHPEVTIDNISSFAQDAFDDLVTLVKDAIISYKNRHPEVVYLNESQKVIENAAFLEMNLQDINFILDAIQDKIDRSRSIIELISQKLDITENVIIPPDDGEIVIGNGSGNLREKNLDDRLFALVYILDNDLDIDINSLKFTKGTNKPKMMRKESYVSVEIDDLSRVVLVCDEVGNATFVFDIDMLKSVGISMDQLHGMTKDDYNELISQNPGIGERFINSKNNWRQNMMQLLTEPLGTDKQESKNEPKQPKSEFTKKEWLSYEDFQIEVRLAYAGLNEHNNVEKWYKQERNNHPKWNSSPYKYYKDKGWIGWPELVGRENQFKKEFLTYEGFRAEVRLAFAGFDDHSDVREWYRKEKNNHPKWRSAPHRYYKEKGWVGWSELIGKENPRKKEFLSYEDFQTEVRIVFVGLHVRKGIQRWYKIEQKNHTSWPSNPFTYYKEKGWAGWRQLVS